MTLLEKNLGAGSGGALASSKISLIVEMILSCSVEARGPVARVARRAEVGSQVKAWVLRFITAGSVALEERKTEGTDEGATEGATEGAGEADDRA